MFGATHSLQGLQTTCVTQFVSFCYSLKWRPRPRPRNAEVLTQFKHIHGEGQSCFNLFQLICSGHLQRSKVESVMSHESYYAFALL